MSATVSVVSNGLTGKDLGNLTAAGVWGNRGQLWGDLMMRCGRCMPSASGTRGVDAVAAYILRGDSSSVLDELGADWMTCKCRIHERVVWGVRGGEGCDALPYGKHGAIRALYEGDHRVCSVEPGVRKYDLDLARLVELGLGRGRNPMWYARGRGTDPGSLGAHYCYAWLFPCNVVVRVARILGPDVPRWRLLLWYSMVGNKYGSPVEFEQLAGGQLHIVSRMGVWASHDQIVRTIMSGDPNSTVGATQEELDRGGVRRVEEVMGSASESLGSRATGHLERWVTALSSEEWKDLDSALASPVDTVYAPVDLVMGVRIPTYGYRLAEVSEYLQGPVFRRLVEFLDRAGVESQFVVCRVGDVDPDVVRRMLDLAVVLHPVGVTPSFYTKPRDRVRIMALVGDAVLRLLGSIGLYGSGGAIADAAVVMEAAENAELVELTKHERLAGLFQFDSLLELSVHRATHFEALLGGVAMFWGVSAAVAVLSSLGHKLARTGPSKFIEPVGRLNTVAVHSWEWKEFQEWKLRA